jgi:hypothetical protein
VFLFGNDILVLIGSLQIRTYKNSDENRSVGRKQCLFAYIRENQNIFSMHEEHFINLFCSSILGVCFILLILHVGGKEPCFGTFSSDENIFYVSVVK